MTGDCVNQALYEALFKQIGSEYNQEKGQEVINAVHETLIDALGVDNKEILPNTGLVSDLLAESIDGLDIKYRLEKKLGLKIDNSPIGMLINMPKNVSEQQTLNYEESGKTVIELTKQAYDLYVRK